MSVALQIAFTNRFVTIIGGGNIALRKAKQFLNEGARITVVAPILHTEFNSLPIIWRARGYAADDVNDCFLIIAASDDTRVNAQVIDDANRAGVLSMSVQHNHQATTQAMLMQELDDVCIAVSTYGQLPSANRFILQSCCTAYSEHFQRKIKIMKMIRTRLLADRIVMSKEITEALFTFSQEQLLFINEALIKQRVLLCVYHGSADTQARTSLQKMNHKIAAVFLDYAVQAAFLSARVLQQVEGIFAYAAIVSLLKQFHVDVYVYGMLLQEGRFSTQLRDVDGVHVLPLPFADQRAVDELLTLLIHAYAIPQRDLVITYHSSKTGKLAQFLHACEVATHVKIENERDVMRWDDMSYTRVLSLFMLRGTHLTDLQQCTDDSCQIICSSLIEIPVIIALLIRKLQEAIKMAEEKRI